jgi:hypothetical protein
VPGPLEDRDWRETTVRDTLVPVDIADARRCDPGSPTDRATPGAALCTARVAVGQLRRRETPGQITRTRTGPVVIVQRNLTSPRCLTDAGVASGFGEALAQDDQQKRQAACQDERDA